MPPVAVRTWNSEKFAPNTGVCGAVTSLRPAFSSVVSHGVQFENSCSDRFSRLIGRLYQFERVPRRPVAALAFGCTTVTPSFFW